ncbi:MAG: MalY/PatB family protein [Veillonellales bacterium]
MKNATLKHDFEEVIDRRGTDCKKWNSYPEDVIPMWIAETDFKCPQPVVDAMVKRAQFGSYGYPISSNTFNQAVVNWQKKRFGWHIEEEWVEFAPAVVPALVYSIRAFTNPGDKVVIQTPVYHPFHHSIVNNGRIKAENELILKNGRYEINFEDLENKLKDPRTKLMLLCSPHNPLNRLFSREELLKIGELCLKHHVIVVADEIHSDLVYWGKKHTPFGTLSEEIKNNCLVCVNPSKTFNIAGTRTAAVIIPNETLRERYHVSTLNNKGEGRTVFGTLPFEVAYNECDYYADQVVEYLEGNIKFMLPYFEEHIPKIKVIKPEATYLMWLDCRELNLSQPELNKFMLEKAKVAMNDGEMFGKPGIGFMRMNVGCRHVTLAEALQRIEKAVNNL